MIDLAPDIHPLFSFGAIFDTDFGLIKLLKDQYRAESTFDLSVLDLPDDDLKKILVSRKDINPLSVCMLDYENNKELANDYYDQFMDNEIVNILDRSAFTAIGRLFILCPTASDDICPAVSFRNKYEVEFLRNQILGSEYKIDYDEVMETNLNCSGYDPIIVKDCMEFATYRNYDGHNIYLPRYGFNMIHQDGKELVEPTIAIGFLRHQCIVSFIDVYKRKEG
jgi:hypothetical protein